MSGVEPVAEGLGGPAAGASSEPRSEPRGGPGSEVAAGAASWTEAEAVTAGATGTVGRIRRAARVILLDPADRILLLHGFEPADPATTWWFTPGGGVEPGESLSAAARREVAEETGISSMRLGPVLWRRRCAFDFDGRRWEQDEWYYLGRTDATRLHTGGHTELERRSVRALRWWTCQELLATRETVYPTRLAELLRRLLDEGPPPSPLLLETERE